MALRSTKTRNAVQFAAKPDLTGSRTASMAVLLKTHIKYNRHHYQFLSLAMLLTPYFLNPHRTPSINQSINLSVHSTQMHVKPFRSVAYLEELCANPSIIRLNRIRASPRVNQCAERLQAVCNCVRCMGCSVCFSGTCDSNTCIEDNSAALQA